MIAPASATASSEIDAALKSLAGLARKMEEVLRVRLKPPPDDSRRFARMGLCLDLRKMATQDGYATGTNNQTALKLLSRWMRTRDSSLPLNSSACDMPGDDELQSQFELLAGRMRTAFGERPFSARWSNASGTVLMVDVFTNERFYSGCRDYLYLFQHCATKTMCEAVVEGMGSVWDKCASPERHPRFEASVEEAVIAWSAPQPWHREAEVFINHALNDHFGAGKPWNFSHSDQRVERMKAWQGGSKVIHHLHNSHPSRLPVAYYDTAV